jgi:hypothetical protein
LVVQSLLRLLPVLVALALYSPCFEINVVGSLGDVIVRWRAATTTTGMRFGLWFWSFDRSLGMLMV